MNIQVLLLRRYPECDQRNGLWWKNVTRMSPSTHSS